jgi:hypothetical protein
MSPYNKDGYAYSAHGRVVIVKTPPTPVVEGARDIFIAMRDDPGIAKGALLLVDARDSEVDLAPGLVRNRVELMWSLLGAKFAPFMAMVPRSSTTGMTMHRVQMDAFVYAGIQIGIFPTVDEARQWLELH